MAREYAKVAVLRELEPGTLIQTMHRVSHPHFPDHRQFIRVASPKGVHPWWERTFILQHADIVKLLRSPRLIAFTICIPEAQ